MDNLIGKVELVNDLGNLTLRRARVFDASESLALINSYASSNLMLTRDYQYFYENIRDFVVVEIAGERAEPKIVACGSLHVLSKDIAEVRALAVHPKFQRCGLGSMVVQHFIEEAQQVQVGGVFAFTLKPEFFEKLGFKLKAREELPYEVWSECIRCPKYSQCNEVGLLFECSGD